jgi:predicted nucleotidyltransferase
MTGLSEAAIADLRERLLSGPHGRDVLKIVIFGSYAKGTAHHHSDLDILLVLNRVEQIADFLAELSIDFHAAYRVGLEPVIATVDELFPITSYFLRNVLSYGKEVYAVPEEDLKSEERRNLLALAEEYLEGARMAAGNGGGGWPSTPATTPSSWG